MAQPTNDRAVDESAFEQLLTELATLLRRATSARFTLPDGNTLERSAYTALHRLQCDGPLRGSDLAGALGLDLSTVSRQISALTQQGLVHKVADPNDGRAALLTLTDDGRKLVECNLQARRAWMSELLANWGDAEIRAFAATLARFNKDLITKANRNDR